MNTFVNPFVELSIRILGCPEAGVSARIFRAERGIFPADSNKVSITLWVDPAVVGDPAVLEGEDVWMDAGQVRALRRLGTLQQVSNEFDIDDALKFLKAVAEERRARA